MKAAQIQQQLKLNAQVITGLHQELTKLKNARKAYNEEADNLASKYQQALEAGEWGSTELLCDSEEAYREQAAVFTPYIKKFVRKIAVMDDIQRALKHELKCAACMEAWMADIDAAGTYYDGGEAPQFIVVEDDILEMLKRAGE